MVRWLLLVKLYYLRRLGILFWPMLTVQDGRSLWTDLLLLLFLLDVKKKSIKKALKKKSGLVGVLLFHCSMSGLCCTVMRAFRMWTNIWRLDMVDSYTTAVWGRDLANITQKVKDFASRNFFSRSFCSVFSFICLSRILRFRTHWHWLHTAI